MSDKTEEEMQLEAELQAMTEEKKAIFQKTREFDEHLMRIREKERQHHERLQQIRTEKVEKDQREKHAAHLEAQVIALSNERTKMIEELNVLRRDNSELNESLTKLKGTLQRTTNYSRTQQKAKRQKEEEIKKLTRHIQRLEDKISNAEIQRHDHDDLSFTESARESEMQVGLAVLRTENKQLKTDRTKEMMEQMVQVSQLKENLQRITSLSKTQQKKIKRLEDEKFAGQQIAVETQLRQLNELESRETLTEEIRQLKETLTTLHRQYQQPTTVEHRRGKYTVSQKTHHLWQAIVSTSID